MRDRRFALLLCTLLGTLSPAMAAIGDSLDAAKKKYGRVVEVNTYRPDLYPTSYVFQVGDAQIHVTPLPQTVSRMDVFFATTPNETPEKLLERYSGRTGWKSSSRSAPAFEREFPHYSPTDSRNAFFVADGMFAMIQRDVGDHKLVIAIQSADYLLHLTDYRRQKKKA